MILIGLGVRFPSRMSFVPSSLSCSFSHLVDFCSAPFGFPCILLYSLKCNLYFCITSTPLYPVVLERYRLSGYLVGSRQDCSARSRGCVCYVLQASTSTPTRQHQGAAVVIPAEVREPRSCRNIQPYVPAWPAAWLHIFLPFRLYKVDLLVKDSNEGAKYKPNPCTCIYLCSMSTGPSGYPFDIVRRFGDLRQGPIDIWSPLCLPVSEYKKVASTTTIVSQLIYTF